MRYLKSFNESVDIYNINWHDIVPENITMIYSDKSYEFVCDRNTNIMKHFDMIQITYTIKGGEVWGVSDTLEFDLYFLKPQSKGIKIDVDITWGNFMESEFSIQSDKVSVIQCTTKDSKFDPTNTVFAFDDESLDKLVKFFNSFQGININREDIMFLHKEGRCPI